MADHLPDRLFVLIHSPLVGPSTWTQVAKALGGRGHRALVPALSSSPAGPRPYWRQHLDQIVDALSGIPRDTPLVLAGHSGGGMLLPLVRQETGRRVSAYIFVDAGIPQDGKSRLDLFESQEAAEGFRQAASGCFLPVWGDDDLRELIPDDGLRRDFIGELRPLPLEVYEEPIPVFASWPDAPLRYLRFGHNPAYDADAARAARQGWPVETMQGGHFHTLVDWESVAEALIRMANG
jgi:pimeloyl-ACP methyl ester carboxylesterase